MEHHHSNLGSNIGRSFKIGILINLVFITIEVLFGFIANSVALLADAGHNFSDVVVLIFS